MYLFVVGSLSLLRSLCLSVVLSSGSYFVLYFCSFFLSLGMSFFIDFFLSVVFIYVCM